jgi:hypothetical protein
MCLQKFFPLGANVEKIGTADHSANDMAHALCMLVTKATNTYSEYVIRYLLVFRGNSGYENALHFYVIRTVPQVIFLYTAVG